MPTPWDTERQRSFRASPPQKLHRYTPDHMLFQLEPRQEILRPEPDAWIMDLIHITANDAKTNTKGSLTFGAKDTTGLHVDFTNRTATLKNTTTTTPSTPTHPQQPATYHPTSPASDLETSLRIQHLEIYNLGGHATTPFEEQLAEKPRLRTVSPKPSGIQVIRGGEAPAPPVSEPRVSEEELRRRIRGFGHSAR